MSKVCEICHRGPKTSQMRSHSKVAAKKWQNINLQMRTIDAKRVKMCSKCLRTSKKV